MVVRLYWRYYVKGIDNDFASRKFTERVKHHRIYKYSIHDQFLN